MKQITKQITKQIHFTHLENKNSNKNIIVLHGFLGSSSNWRSLAKHIPHSVFLIDLRNHGYSFHSDEMSYPLMAEDILDFCCQNELKEVSIIGHSMGGKVAMQCLKTFEEKVKISSMIVIDIWAKQYQPRHEKILNSLMDLNLSQKRENILKDLTSNVKDKGLAQFLLKNLTIDKNSKQEKFIWRNNLKALAEQRNFLLQKIDLDEKIEIPFLLMKGEESDYVLSEDIEEMKKIFVNGKVSIFENCGHWVHVDNPKRLLEEVIDFLDIKIG